MHTNARFSPALAIIMTLSTLPLCSGATFNFSLDTMGLFPLNPTSLNFQLIDGSGSGDANTTVIVRNILLGAAILGPPQRLGGVSGDLASTVTLTDSSFFNSFLQDFTLGNSLSFTVDYTTNVDAGPT